MWRSDPHGMSAVSFAKADLTGADVRAADLADADLSGATLQDVHWNELTRWPEGYTPPEPAQSEPPQPVPPWRALNLGGSSARADQGVRS